METKPCIAAILLLLATWLPSLAPKPAAPAPAACEDRKLVELMDPEGIRGQLPLVLCPAEARCAEGEDGDGCAIRQPRGAARILLGEALDLNDATESELLALPGIGPGRARRIAATRDRLGGYRSLQDLRRVEGLGARRIASLAAWARAGPVQEVESSGLP